MAEASQTTDMTANGFQPVTNAHEKKARELRKDTASMFPA